MGLEPTTSSLGSGRKTTVTNGNQGQLLERPKSLLADYSCRIDHSFFATTVVAARRVERISVSCPCGRERAVTGWATTSTRPRDPGATLPPSMRDHRGR